MKKDFSEFDFSGSNSITHSGIEKHFKNVKPWQAIAELIWNGFDAEASTVNVAISENEAHGTEAVTVLDNGHGIDFRRADENFKRFNDSLKKTSYDTHGSQGRGRLAFCRISNAAAWYTRTKTGSEDAVIRVDSSNLSDVLGKSIQPEETHALLSGQLSGTCVELSGFRNNLPRDESLIAEFSREFGGHLVLLPHKKLYLNSNEINPQPHTSFYKNIEVDKQTYNIRLIRWHSKPGTEKSLVYFVNDQLKILHKQLSTLNNKPEYYTSIYISSENFDRYSPTPETLAEPFLSFLHSKTYRKLNKALTDFLKENYSEFLIQQASEQVEKYEVQGDFPEHNELDSSEKAWRLEHVKDIVKNIIIRDPTLLIKSNKKQRRLIIRLLDKLAVSNENSAIFDVLESILNLDTNEMDKFAKQITQSKLENIIQTIEVLQNRELAVNQIREIMNIHYKDVLETPDLQKVIENNTWLFGPSYSILGAEEDNFTSITKKLRSQISTIDSIVQADIDDAPIIGANRQVDLFLARKTPVWEDGKQYFKCVIIEIKRPSISLNTKHLQQVDEYASILSNYQEFSSHLTKFELLLVGRKLSSKDHSISSRMSSMRIHGEPGLVTSDGKVKTYVKTWATICDEFDLTNQYLLGNLKTRRASLEAVTKSALLDNLQNNIVLPDQEALAPA